MNGAGELGRPVALVTGGGGDIGRAIAVRLARMSRAVVVVDIDDQAAARTASQVQSKGCAASVIRADVSSPQQMKDLVDAVEIGFGPIGIFANNAGIEGVVAPLHEYPDDVFDRVIHVNVKGVFLGLKYVLAKMIPRGWGAIVNTASTSAIRGRAGLSGYVASKHAVLGLTRTAALEVAGTRVRINAILPGPVESRMIRELDDQARRNAQDFGRAGSARYGKPENIADVVAFLASEGAAHVNGAAWVVDDGITAG